MKIIVVAILALMLTVSGALAASTKTYQVTGPVLEVKDNMVVVEKGKEKWEIEIDKETKITGDLKVGSKVTIQYQMKAKSIEAKAADAKADKKKK